MQKRQEALRKNLNELSERLKGLGLDPTKDFGEASDAMKRAKEALKDGDGNRAVNEEGNALEALRKGAQSTMQQMQEMAQQQGQSGSSGSARSNQGNGGEDPLGRQQGTRGFDPGKGTKIPDEIDTQRAREILDAIRKKLSDPNRSAVEKQYLERLLEKLR